MKNNGIVTVQTGRSVKQDLTSLVTASGEIKPLKYINIGANVMGRLTEINVKEGDRVVRNQVLAKLESVQAEADVAAQNAALNSSLADATAAESGLKAVDENMRTVQASVDRANAELERARLDYERAGQLWKEKLIARQEFDTKKAQYDALEAGLRESQARVSQMKAQREQTAAQLSASQRRVAQVRATLNRFSDVLQKHNASRPIDGIVTNLPVRVGETVVPGIQNSSASLIMTIADMSLITAEVKVDETDIVNVKLRPGGRHHHRRHSEQDVQGARDRDRQHGHPPLHRPGGHPERRFQPGSQGFQGRGRAGQSARRRSARAFPARRRSPRPHARKRSRFRSRR